jgi:hypothetical protein
MAALPLASSQRADLVGVSTVFELWDTSVGTVLAACSNEREMAELIHFLVQHHGRQQLSNLGTSIDDQDGNQLNLLTGSVLKLWVDDILDRSKGIHERVVSKAS